MKLSKKQKNTIFKVFAERLFLAGVGCPFCKQFVKGDTCKKCRECEEYSNCELTNAEANNLYWADIEAALGNKV